MTNITNQIKTIVAEYTDENLDQLSSSQTLTDIGIDSLAVVEIIFDLEEAFDITVPSEQELAQRNFSLAHLDDVVHLVSTLINEKED